jgi:hypothetical protein
MARKAEEYALELLTPDELDLILMVREAERFTGYAWDRYGENWKDHIPTLVNAREWCSPEVYEQVGPKFLEGAEAPRPVINAFTQWFFSGFRFQNYQVEAHYAPQGDVHIMGGVGSGKTGPTTISAISRATLNPGYGVLWVAPILPQAKLAYDGVLQWGMNGRWGEVFLKDHRRHPYPFVEIRPWDRHDPGSRFECRSLGQDPAELLRGGEFDEAVADEAMRAYSTSWYIALLTGRLRGPKPYMLNAYPELRDEYNDWVEAIEWAEGKAEREQLRKELEEWVADVGIAKQTRLTVIGNAPKGAEWWRRWEWGHKHPEKRYSVRWSTRQNVYVTQEQIDLQMRQFHGREEHAAVELDAMRPPSGGDVFPYLDSFFSGDLLAEAIQHVADGDEGWIVKSYEEYGVYHYEKALPPGTPCAFALDPGSGVIGKRNQWVILGVRLDKGPWVEDDPSPFEIVYARAGNLPGQHGTPDPWIAAAKDVRSRYNIPNGHFAVESSGVQKNTHWVVWRDDLQLVPFFLNNQMMTLIVEAQRTVGADMWWCPDIPLFSAELGEFKYVMPKDEPQDWVSSFLLLNHLVYPLVHEKWEYVESEDEEYWEVYEGDGGREVRDTVREVRYGR